MTLVEEVVADAEREVEAVEALRGQHRQVRRPHLAVVEPGLVFDVAREQPRDAADGVGRPLQDRASARPARRSDPRRGARGRPVPAARRSARAGHVRKPTTTSRVSHSTSASGATSARTPAPPSAAAAPRDANAVATTRRSAGGASAERA